MLCSWNMDWFDVVFLETTGFVVYELWNDYHGCVVLARVLAFFLCRFFDCNFRFPPPLLLFRQVVFIEGNLGHQGFETWMTACYWTIFDIKIKRIPNNNR